MNGFKLRIRSVFKELRKNKGNLCTKFLSERILIHAFIKQVGKRRTITDWRTNKKLAKYYKVAEADLKSKQLPKELSKNTE